MCLDKIIILEIIERGKVNTPITKEGGGGYAKGSFENQEIDIY